MSTGTITRRTPRLGNNIMPLAPRRAFANDPNRGCAPGKADPDAFFPTTRAGTVDVDRERITVAAHCQPCPVRAACAEWAVHTGQDHGVWGAMTSRQLRAAVARHRDLAADEPAPEPAVAQNHYQPDVPYDPRDVLDPKVAALHAAGRSDKHIAIALGVHPKTVKASRDRQHLPTLYGPGGRPVRQAVSA